jgi:hypothetical protein
MRARFIFGVGLPNQVQQRYGKSGGFPIGI